MKPTKTTITTWNISTDMSTENAMSSRNMNATENIMITNIRNMSVMERLMLMIICQQNMFMERNIIMIMKWSGITEQKLTDITMSTEG